MTTQADRRQKPPRPLKPCPFCGERMVEIIGHTQFFVRCEGCRVWGPVRKTRDQAMQAWNERH